MGFANDDYWQMVVRLKVQRAQHMTFIDFKNDFCKVPKQPIKAKRE
jgi:hypothetical protein